MPATAGRLAEILVYIYVPCVLHWDFYFFKILRHSEERAIHPWEGLSTPHARRVGHRRPFFRQGQRGLMCRAGLARSWCREGSDGARDSQLFFGYAISGIFKKNPFGHHYHHHHHHHYRGALYNKDVPAPHTFRIRYLVVTSGTRTNARAGPE